MRINPGLRVISLADGSVCIGSGPGGLWIGGLDDGDRAFIASLGASAVAAADGPAGGHPPGPTPAPALITVSEERAGELLAALAPVLVPEAPFRIPGTRASMLAPDIAQWSAAYGRHAGPAVEVRSRAVVRIHGLDRCGQSIASLLAAAGVGTVALCDPGRVEPGDLGVGPLRLADLGMPRPRALARSLSRHWTHTRFPEWTPRFGGTAQEADATVVVTRDWVGADVAGHLAQTQIPHLRVLFTDTGARVGPLVVPGLTACLDCSPVPGLPAQVLDADAAPATAPEVSAAATAAGLAVMQILMLVDGVNVPEAADAVICLDLGTGGITREAVAPGPDCLCLARAA